MLIVGFSLFCLVGATAFSFLMNSPAALLVTLLTVAIWLPLVEIYLSIRYSRKKE